MLRTTFDIIEMYTQDLYFLQIIYSTIAFLLYFFILGYPCNKLFKLNLYYAPVFGFSIYTGFIVPILVNIYTCNYSLIWLLSIIALAITFIGFKINEKNEIISKKYTEGKSTLIIIILLSIWIVSQIIIGTKPVPPGGDTVGTIIDLFYIDKLFNNPVYFQPYSGFFLIIHFVSDVLMFPLHSIFAGFKIFLYLLYFLAIGFMASIIFNSKNVTLFSIFIGVLISAPFTFFIGPTTHLWGIVTLLTTVILWILFDQTKNSTFQYITCLMCPIIIIYNYLIMWPIFLIFVFSYNLFMIINIDSKSKLLTQMYYMIIGLALCISFFYRFSFSFINVFNSYYLIMIFCLLICYAFLYFAKNYEYLIVWLIRDRGKKFLLIFFFGLILINIVLLIFHARLLKHDYWNINLFYRYGILIFIMASVGNYLIIKKYPIYLWIVILHILNLFIFDISYIFWIIFKLPLFWRIIKELYNAKGAFILPLILSSLPFIHYLLHYEDNKKYSVTCNY